uniref:Uncharacterized protein n=1 Tax=Rousettus aegyptiacus TaxID=9407 RepID=A0A7J8E8B1_ROUAE|nr:hypothetical protein HJG63_008134 [Rousettus aegyptiacus]
MQTIEARIFAGINQCVLLNISLNSTKSVKENYEETKAFFTIWQNLIKYCSGKTVHLPIKNSIAIVFEIACSSSIVDRDEMTLHLNRISIGLSNAGTMTCEPGSSPFRLIKECKRKCLELW